MTHTSQPPRYSAFSFDGWEGKVELHYPGVDQKQDEVSIWIEKWQQDYSTNLRGYVNFDTRRGDQLRSATASLSSDTSEREGKKSKVGIRRLFRLVWRIRRAFMRPFLRPRGQDTEQLLRGIDISGPIMTDSPVFPARFGGPLAEPGTYLAVSERA